MEQLIRQMMRRAHTSPLPQSVSRSMAVAVPLLCKVHPVPKLWRVLRVIWVFWRMTMTCSLGVLLSDRPHHRIFPTKTPLLLALQREAARPGQPHLPHHLPRRADFHHGSREAVSKRPLFQRQPKWLWIH